MNRFVCLLLLTLSALPARAGWTALTVPVAPEDVDVWRANQWTFSAGAAGAYLYSGSMHVTELTGLNARGTALTPEGCLAALGEDGQLHFSCPTGGSPPPEFLFDQGAVALRGTPDGGAYALQNSGIDVFVHYLEGGVGPGAAPVGQSITGLPPNDVLAVHRLAGADLAAFGTLSGGIRYLSGASPSKTFATTGEVEVLELFGITSPEALYSTSEAGLFHADLSASPVAVSGVPLPTGFSHLSGLSYELGTGDPALGEGFGVAVAQGTSTALLSALPKLGSEPAGRLWKVSTAPPAGVDLTGFTRVDCASGLFCVAIRPVSGAPNVLIYENLSGPVPSLPSTSDVVAPGTLVEVNASASDPDGDAVRLTWRQVGGTPFTFTAEEGRLTVDTSGIDACAGTSASFEVTASDGVLGHENRATYTLETTQADLAIGAPSATVLALACDGSLSQTVSLAPVPNACNDATFVWTKTAGPALAGEAQSLVGSTVQLELPPGDLSHSVGQPLRFDVVASDGAMNTVTRELAFELSREPFLGLFHTPSPPLSSDGDLLEITATISNPEGCRVSTVELEERLTGLTLIEDSVTQDGRRLTVERVGEDTWRLRGIDMAEETAQVRFLARRTPFGEAAISGTVLVGAVPMSSEAGWGDASLTAAGCGCTTGASGLAGWAALVAALVMLLRPRRVE